MTCTGSTDYKSGKIPYPIIWMYTIMLKHYGYINSISENWDINEYTREYIIMSENGHELNFNIHITQGTIDAHIKQGRRYADIYEIGSGRVIGNIWR